MPKVEVLITTEDGTVLQAFDVSDPNMAGDISDVRLSNNIRNVLSAHYEVEDK